MPLPPPPPGGPPPGGPPPRLGRVALVAGAASMLGRLSGLARDVIFTAAFGAGATADAWYAAFRVPGLFRELLAEGTLANVAVPLLAEADAREGRAGLWALANALLGALLLILGAVTLLILFAAGPLVSAIAAGFGQEPEKMALAVWLTRLLSPFLAGLSVASLLGGMLNVRGRFFLPALAPAALNGAVIAACLLGSTWERATGTPAIGAVAAAATLSGLVTASAQLPPLWREGFRFRPNLRGHPALGKAARFVGAALVGVVTVQASLLIETQIASRYGDGPVSWLTLGFRLVQLPLSVVSGSVAVASLAGLSTLLARGDRDGARREVGEALSLNSLLVLPCGVALYLLADPLVRLFFERGAFTPADSLATAEVLRMYALAVMGICLHRVLLPVYFALGDPYLPMRLSLVVLVSKLPLALLLVEGLGLGVAGLPLSHALTVTGEVAALLWLLGRRMQGFAPGFWAEQGRIALASAGLGALLWALRGQSAGLGVVWVSALGGVAYGALALILRVRSAGRLLRRRRPPR